MIRTMLDPRDLNGVSFLTTKNVPISKNICYNITALWDILNQKCVKKIMPISGCTNHRAINAKKNWCFLTIYQNWSAHKNQLILGLVR